MAKTELALPEVEERKVGSLYSRTDLLKAISDFLFEVMPEIGYPEHHRLTDIRIVLCAVCSVCAMYAQFGTKFPDDRPLLIVLVMAYFAVTGVVTLLDLYVIRDAMMCIELKDGTAASIEVSLPMFSSEVELKLTTSKRMESLKTDIGKWFDTDGYLNNEPFFKDLTGLLHRLESPKEESKKQL